MCAHNWPTDLPFVDVVGLICKWRQNIYTHKRKVCRPLVRAHMAWPLLWTAAHLLWVHELCHKRSAATHKRSASAHKRGQAGCARTSGLPFMGCGCEFLVASFSLHLLLHFQWQRNHFEGHALGFLFMGTQVYQDWWKRKRLLQRCLSWW